jgi:hypothetical protein
LSTARCCSRSLRLRSSSRMEPTYSCKQARTRADSASKQVQQHTAVVDLKICAVEIEITKQLQTRASVLLQANTDEH